MRSRHYSFCATLICLILLKVVQAAADDVKNANSTIKPKLIISETTGMKLILIPAGTFNMGSSDADVELYVHRDSRFKAWMAKDEQPQHSVRISRDFYMGIYEVTQGEYAQIMGTNPSYFAKTGFGKGQEMTSDMDTSRFPVEWVSWYDAIDFCNKMSQKDGLSARYSMAKVERRYDSIKSAAVTVLPGDGYRLPTEAEWEYACRANSTTPFNFGGVLNGDLANINGTYPFGTTTNGNELSRTVRVGSYPDAKNEFGLFDVHGNVWEWCFDAYDDEAYAKRTGTTMDPVVMRGSGDRVLRGGSFYGPATNAFSSNRFKSDPGLGANYFGFRVVR